MRTSFGRRRALTERLRSEFIVTTRSGDAFRGVLWDVDEQVVVLRNASQLNAREDGSPMVVPVDGEVVVMVADVALMQRP